MSWITLSRSFSVGERSGLRRITKRERVVIVGFRSDIGEDWSFPSPTHSEDALVFSQWVTNEYWDKHRIGQKQRPLITTQIANRLMKMEEPKLQSWQTVRDAIADLPKPSVGTKETISNHRFQPGARIYAGHTGSPLDFPAKTLKAGDHGVPGGENMLVLADGSVRYFTVRESARLQTFPDWFSFPCSWTESMRQIGMRCPFVFRKRSPAAWRLFFSGTDAGSKKAINGNSRTIQSLKQKESWIERCRSHAHKTH